MKSLFGLLFLLPIFGYAQRLTIEVRTRDTREPVVSATVSVDGKSLGVTDSLGIFQLSLAPARYRIGISATGYLGSTLSTEWPGRDSLLFFLEPDDRLLDSVTVVASTRNNQPIEYAPLKVEILGKEEMDEENTIKPANIASILGDISGIQIQQSSAVSGNANVRIQGLEGRYTQILRDGMPLYDGFSGGFGILTIPPLDLKQIELIKGSASTLYGGGAIGGLVNLISKRPARKQEAILTLNASTLEEKNVNAWASRRNNHLGYTLFAGYTNQTAKDVNKDGFSDLPDMKTFIVHPTLFIYPSANSSIAAGYTGTFEKRTGGDMLVVGNKAGGEHQYFEKNRTERHTAEFTFDQHFSNQIKMQVKASWSDFYRGITTHQHAFRGKQQNYFTEASLLITKTRHNFVGGVNFTGDRFLKLPSDPILLSDFSNDVAGAFAQYTATIQDRTTLEAGLRLDHTRFGNFLLPRVAAFHRFNAHWGSRIGLGWGYKTPNALSQQVRDFPIETILPAGSQVMAEKSIGGNAEINYKLEWGEDQHLFINHAFFFTTITDPILFEERPDKSVQIFNAAKPVFTRGFDTYIQLELDSWELYAGYTFTVAERRYLTDHRFMPLTPKTRMAYTLVKNWANKWRLGLEGSYTGRQHRFDYSYTPGYFFMAAMIERKFGRHISLILNGENLLDYRQSRKEVLYTGSISDPVFSPLWAPIDGRVINMSLRFNL